MQAAVDAGAELRTGTAVTSYRQDAAGVQLTTSQGAVRAWAVVGADGSTSRAGAHVGVVCAQVDLGMEAELPVPDGSDWSGRLLLDWGPVPGSYGWVFPKGRGLTVGVIGARRHGGAVRDCFRAFVAAQGLDLSRGEHVGGHLTRVRTASSPLRRDRVLVAGDAAGLLEPWTREGISFALRSGALAGRAAATDAAGYDRAVQRELAPEMDAGRRALATFQPPPARRAGGAAPGAGDVARLVRLVSGSTTLPEQLGSRAVRTLVSALGG